MPNDTRTKQTKAPEPPVPIPWWKRRQTLWGLFVALAVAGFVIVVYPFAPLLTYKLFPPKTNVFPYASRLEKLPVAGQKETAPVAQAKPKPVGNRLVIPKIGVDIAVVDGVDDSALLRGAWRMPQTSDTPTTGNMVLSAHRFRYRPPSSATFYLLDKIGIGDTLILYWQGKEYDYRVSETKIITPETISILNPTVAPQLTLYTCTPLFSTAKRLVVIGTPL